MTDQQSTSVAPGERLVQELLWVHGMVRRDLATLQRLSAEVGAGAAPVEVRAGIRILQTEGPLWQLRLNCLRYCHFVHSHHGAESALIFPAVRRFDPALGPVVDRLEADHLAVADLLDAIEALADELLDEPAGDGVRSRLVAALEQLATHLLEHLDFEEESISPVLRQWRRWP